MNKNTLRIIFALLVCNIAALSNLYAQTEDGVSIFDLTTNEASYKGGQPDLKDYFVKNITFPNTTEEDESSARLKFKMHIAADGTPSIVEFTNVEANDPVRIQLEAIVPNMPKWYAAQDNNKSRESIIFVEMQYKWEQLLWVIYDETEVSKGIDIAQLSTVIIKEQSSDIEERPFVTVEQMPMYVGGETKMVEFIEANLQYPEVSKEAGVQGRVTVRFVVKKDGSISNVTIIRGVDKACDKEAIRIVKAMPNWEPGRQNGVNVPVYFTLPIIFRITD